MSAMIYTRKLRVINPEPLRLPGAEMAYATSVRYLGVQLDAKLYWREHIETQMSRTYASQWACKRAMGRDWGFSPKISLWLYKMVLLPRLMYAAVVWWPSAKRVEIRNRLTCLRRNFPRAATGAMRTIPTDPLDVPSLDHLVVSRAESTAYRHMCQGKWMQAEAAHVKLEILKKNRWNMYRDRMTKKYQIRNAFKTYIPERENWETVEKTGTNVRHWYTDGSGYRGYFGAGLYGPEENYRCNWSLGTMATVFQAELPPIKKCSELLVS
ncbi:uncharacterized protein [Fopius arisanus]|uniref:Uncharacterized protein n=1 Tax=Fopius arisanus TaxID=64838 RepID=A0A9R1TPD1_9HYME|nr:PREDICTED: uncharacterized protein LOC105272482 [Fopius arisanus]